MAQQIIWFIVLIALSAFFAGMEIAYFSLSPARLRTLVRHKLPGAAAVEKLKNRPQRLLVTILLINNLVNIAAAAIATQIALEFFGSLGVGVATGVVTFLILVFGEIFPKALSQVYAPTITRYTARLILILQTVLLPIIFLFEQLIYLVTPKKNRFHQITEEEIRSLIHLGVEAGSVEAHELEFLDRLFRFNDELIANIMVPVKELVILDGDANIENIAHFVANSGYSRFPVYDGSKQNVIGIVHIKDIFRANNSQNRDKPVRSLISKPHMAKSDEILDDVFRRMRELGTHHMLVHNKNEKTVGMVTFEDLIEELIGEGLAESDLPQKLGLKKQKQ